MERLPEWSDDRRMHVLYGAFPAKETNPDAYHSRLAFWLRAVPHAIKYAVLRRAQESQSQILPEAYSGLAFSVEELQYAFRRKNIKPLGLPIVLVFLFFVLNEISSWRLSFCPTKEGDV